MNTNHLQIDKLKQNFQNIMNLSTDISKVKLKVNNKLDELQKASMKRLKANPSFQEIETHAKWLKTQRDIDIYPLNIDKYTQMEQYQKVVNDGFKDVLTQ